MLPFSDTSILPRPIRDIIDKAMHLPKLSHRYEFIAVKCGAAARKWNRELYLAETRHYTKLFDLENYLRRCGIRNSWQLLDCLVRATDAASEKDILNGLSCAEFESGHDALKLAEDLGELRALIMEAHFFRDALSDVAAGLRLALDIERQCLDLALQQVHPAVACQNDRRTGGASADLPKATPDMARRGQI
jgi:hypothetical protein